MLSENGNFWVRYIIIKIGNFCLDWKKSAGFFQAQCDSLQDGGVESSNPQLTNM